MHWLAPSLRDAAVSVAHMWGPAWQWVVPLYARSRQPAEPGTDLEGLVTAHHSLAKGGQRALGTLGKVCWPSGLDLL